VAYKRFEDLKVWQLSRDFRKAVYEITKKFPKQEQYALTDNIRRAANSVACNIAEGHGRYHFQENIQCCRISRGSVNEVLDQLYTAIDAKYIKKEEFDILYKQGREVEQVLNGYIAYLQEQVQETKA